MLSWHNNPALKAEVVERMHMHREHDTIVQGTYQQYAPEKAHLYKGCAIGCTLPRVVSYAGVRLVPSFDEGWHDRVQSEYGIPSELAYMIDTVFEALRPPEHAKFAVDVIEAVPVGVDLEPVVVALRTDLATKYPRLLRDLLKRDGEDDAASYALYQLFEALDPSARTIAGRNSRGYWRWVRDRFLTHLRNQEPVPAVPLIQHVDIPEPEKILIRSFVNN